MSHAPTLPLVGRVAPPERRASEAKVGGVGVVQKVVHSATLRLIPTTPTPLAFADATLGSASDPPHKGEGGSSCLRRGR
jgi:hypothetical protein